MQRCFRGDTLLKSEIWHLKSSETWSGARGVAGRCDDPLLPGRILPSDYLGQQAWWRRVEAARRWPATAHVQPRKSRGRPRVTQDKFMLHMQHEVGQPQSRSSQPGALGRNPLGIRREFGLSLLTSAATG